MSGNPFQPFLERSGYVVLDGGLATALEAEGHILDDKLWSARLIADRPDAIRAVHAAYLEAGADCITTASYQASVSGFATIGIGPEEAEDLLRRSTTLALEARRAYLEARSRGTARPLVAASVGPYGAYLADGSEYDGRYGIGVEELTTFHRRRFEVLASSGADLLACETIPSGLEARVLLGLLDECPETCAWMSFCCADERSLYDGTSIEEVVELCASHARVAAVGVNCTNPDHVGALISRARSAADVPLIVYPNSGEAYDGVSGGWSGPRSDWLVGVRSAVGAGARVVGGCCRVGPGEIRKLRDAVDAGHWPRGGP